MTIVARKAKPPLGERAFWLMVRRGLLMVVAAIELYLAGKPEEDS